MSESDYVHSGDLIDRLYVIERGVVTGRSRRHAASRMTLQIDGAESGHVLRSRPMTEGSCPVMKIRAAVLNAMGLPRPYAGSRP